MATISENNIASNPGDVLTVSFIDSFKSIVRVNSFSDKTIGEINTGTPANSRYFSKEFRYSVDNARYSAWKPITDLAWSEIAIESGNDIWLEIRYTRAGLRADGDLSVTDVSFDITYYDTETLVTPPSALSCGSPNYCGGILVDCDGELFDPYNINPAICLYKQISLAVSDIFGHCVRFFRVLPDETSKDVIFREYSVYNVNCVKDVNVLVPDNEFPDNQVAFGFEEYSFEQPFEVHIVKEEFERAFGQVCRPQEKDIIYFPLTNRMYEINSAYLFDDFMQQASYYRVNLVKWDDKANILREEGSVVDVEIQSLTTNLDELFGEDVEKEKTRIRKVRQYSTTGIGNYDLSRNTINNELEILTEDINNNFTIVARYIYDLTGITAGDMAIEYKAMPELSASEDLTFMSWISDRSAWIGTTGPDTATIINGLSGPTGAGLTGSTGMFIELGYGSTAQQTNSLRVKLNETDYTFSDFPGMTSTQFYGLVINVSNLYDEVSVYLWEMKYDASLAGNIAQSTELSLVYSDSIGMTGTDATGTEFDLNFGYSLEGGPIYLTNIRLMKENIPEEFQPLILNQYVIKEPEKAILIDNAIQPLKRPRLILR